MTDKKMPFFSVIIPTLNEEHYLPLLLDDLDDQTFKDFEVIVIDASSEDKTVAEAEKFNEKLDLQVVTAKRKGAAAQRNQGGDLARADWLIFMDADDRLPKYFLEGIKYRISRGKSQKKLRFDLFTTLVHLNDADKHDPLNKSTISFINVALKAVENTDKPAAFGAFIGIKAEIFERIKFSTDAKVMEDCLLVEEAKKKGFKFKVLTDPTYAYSLRRFKAKGLGKTAITGLRVNLLRILGEDFKENDYGYEMLGGEDYE